MRQRLLQSMILFQNKRDLRVWVQVREAFPMPVPMAADHLMRWVAHLTQQGLGVLWRSSSPCTTPQENALVVRNSTLWSLKKLKKFKEPERFAYKHYLKSLAKCNLRAIVFLHWWVFLNISLWKVKTSKGVMTGCLFPFPSLLTVLLRTYSDLKVWV